MRPHPAFADRPPPERARLGPFGLRVLGVADLDEDMAAIAESAAQLRGLFGTTWPDGLTREQDLIDLAWHQKEFADRRSFAWVIADEAGRYIGCAYVVPTIGRADEAEVWWWLRTTALAAGPAFAAAFAAWLDGPDWPPLRYVRRV